MKNKSKNKITFDKSLFANSKNLLSFYTNKIVDEAVRNHMMADLYLRRDFISDVKEYFSLSNRFWKRKRALEKSIIYAARLWLPVIEKEQARLDAIPIKFRRISALDIKPKHKGAYDIK